MALHELPHPVVESRALHLGLADLARRELQPLFGVPDDRVLHLVAVLCEQRAVARREAQRALYLEDVPGVGEVGLAVLDVAAERFEGGALPVQHLRDAPVHRQSPEIAAPRDPHALEVTAEVAAEAVARLGDRDRRAAVGPGHHAQHQRQIRHRARHRARHVQGSPRRVRRPRWDAADRAAQTEHVTEARRIPERAAGVAAVGDRHHPAGERHGGAAARAAARLREIVWIQRAAEDLVECLRARAELGRVGLAEGDRAGPPQPFDEQRVLVGDVVAVDP